MTTVEEVEAGERRRAYYDRIAAEYDEQMAADAPTRLAFQRFVEHRVAAGSWLLDFGCGTGLDAMQYANDGYRVVGCDVSAAMLERFRQRCARFLDEGKVECVHAGTLPEYKFVERPAAIVSNFAVLCLVGDLRPVFTLFARILAPEGRLLLSTLNPLFLGDVRTSHWWKALPGALRSGSMHLEGEPVDSYRHWARALDRAARPQFVRGAMVYCVEDELRTSPLAFSPGKFVKRHAPVRVAARYQFVEYCRCE